MAITIPTINRIIRMTAFDVLRTKITPGNMYICLDSKQLYYDEDENKRVLYYYTGVKTLNDLMYNITPAINTTYYCWEDNSLWLWMNKWITLYSDTTYPSAYVYDDSNVLNEVYRYDQPNMPADDNGLLKDGSVVIRDRQRIIKGKIYIDDGNDNLIISSFLGGGLRFLPNGKLSTDGELLIGDDGITTLRSEFHTINKEMYVDYSNNPELDENEYPNTEHKYKVFHEGNLDTSAIKVLTPYDIYSRLLNKDDLPEVFEFNVKQLEGKGIEDLASATHTHTATDITDFTESARTQATVATKQIFDSLSGNGIKVSYNSSNSSFTMTPESFNIILSGGVTGTGTVEQLNDVNINVAVDGTKHTHEDLQNSIDLLQAELDSINSVDPGNYYSKEVIDTKLLAIEGTSTPVSGKPLLVNNNLELPINTTTASALNHDITLNLIGNVYGTVTIDTTQQSAVMTTTLASYQTTIGDGISTTYLVTHNLNSTNIIVQFRDTITKEQLHLYNTIVNNNTISIQSDTVLDSQSVNVYIIKL